MCNTRTSSLTPFVVKDVSFWGSLIQNVLGVLSDIGLAIVKLLPLHTVGWVVWLWVFISLLSLLALISWFRMLKTLFCVSSGFLFGFVFFFFFFLWVAAWAGSLEVLTYASGSTKEGTGIHAEQTQDCAFWHKVIVRLLQLYCQIIFWGFELPGVFSQRDTFSLYGYILMSVFKLIYFKPAFWKKWVLCDHIISVYLI